MTRIPKGITGLLGALLAAAACSALPPAAGVTDVTPTATAKVAPTGSCHARGSGLETLPDAACTPGGTNADVTQATIAVTICRRGWTASVRPPESYTEPLKRELMAAYGDSAP